MFPIHKSIDLVNWELVGHVFPTHDSRPKWAEKDFWAPEIHILPTSTSTFHLYFTAREYNSNVLCIGVAVSTGSIIGPYKDLLGKPLLKNETVGSIDATVMSVPDASAVSGWIHYLVWKDDGNGIVPQIPTWIWAQQLSMDGLRLIGQKYPLIRNDLVWEGALVEGPWIIQFNKTWYLFYSANAYYNELYAVGVARSDNPLGPYVKYKYPILHSNQVWIGPGHCSVIPVNDYFVMIYHSWYQAKVGGDNDRLMLMDRLYWKDGWPFILNNSPSIDPQPAPTSIINQK